MTGATILSGRRILVLEDEYYMATDAAEALRKAGAEIVGPFPTEGAARAGLDQQRPDAVVVDINLGRGPSFEFARTLRERGVPFLFVTGYGQEVIPPAFGDVERLEKPVRLQEVVESVAKLLGPTENA